MAQALAKARAKAGDCTNPPAESVFAHLAPLLSKSQDCTNVTFENWASDGPNILNLLFFVGLVKTALILDRETTDTYHFTAHVRDATMPEWECLSSIEIHVLDSNDNHFS